MSRPTTCSSVRRDEWGIEPREYAKLQMLSPAADWRQRRMVVPKAMSEQFLDCPDGGLEELPNGWHKVVGSLQWFWVERDEDGEDATP